MDKIKEEYYIEDLDVIKIKSNEYESCSKIDDINNLIKKNLSDDQLQTIKSQNNYFFDLIKETDVIEPIYDPLKLICMLEYNTRLSKCIEIKSRQTAGLGYEIKINKDFLSENPELIKEANSQKTIIEKFFKFCNRNLPFPELLFRIGKDKETTGNGYMEVSRDLSGRINKLNYIPSHTIRKLNDGGFVHYRGNNSLYFKEFGDDRVVDARDGTESDNRLPLIYRSNEIIHFDIFSSISSYYGAPRWIPAIASIISNRIISERNIFLFKNNSTPKFIIAVSNANLDKESVKSIKELFKADLKGNEKSGSGLVIQTSNKQLIGDRNANRKIDVIKFDSFKEEATFDKSRKANDEEIRESFGIASSYFSPEGTNRGSSDEQRKNTIRNEFLPDIEIYEHIINQTIINDFGFDFVEFKLKRPKELDSEVEANINNIYSQNGIKSINEIRKELDLPPYPNEFVFGKLPLPIALTLLEFGLLSQPFITESKEFSVISSDENQQNSENQNADDFIVNEPKNSNDSQDFIINRELMLDLRKFLHRMSRKEIKDKFSNLKEKKIG